MLLEQIFLTLLATKLQRYYIQPSGSKFISNSISRSLDPFFHSKITSIFSLQDFRWKKIQTFKCNSVLCLLQQNNICHVFPRMRVIGLAYDVSTCVYAFLDFSFTMWWVGGLQLVIGFCDICFSCTGTMFSWRVCVESGWDPHRSWKLNWGCTAKGFRWINVGRWTRPDLIPLRIVFISESRSRPLRLLLISWLLLARRSPRLLEQIHRSESATSSI